MTAAVKRCAKCRQEHPVTRFSPNPRIRDGLSSWCRPCASEATRRWRASNPEAIAQANAARRVAYEPRECIGCGLTFRPPRIDSKHCCRHCRQLCAANATPLLRETAADHVANHHRDEFPEWLARTHLPPRGA